ncbi:unnamed protein product [Prorocentrum cordatum]|uniref:EamA domain-containing protein n=1 Tax=Prorocentrum cordatum TaxID=2364126 RepID=A0ABN9XAC1_9DINO|nr:unnamed protein product [Polarella glacialis]|mmetsp:Transcript_49908/g.134253  ORF Transcript_49908/g.134253 Transcript_49908/m.134253 type:complete len:340 (+) Transcript_49908:100-1119(+)
MALASWTIYTFATLLLWGLWGFFSALAEQRLARKTTFAWHCIAIAVCAAFGVPFVGLQLPRDQAGLLILGGAGYAQGVMWMVDAIAAGGPVGVVVTIASMYPMVIVGLNWLVLSRVPTLKQAGGVAAALASLLCFMQSSDEGSDTPAGRSRSTRSSRFRWMGLCMFALLGYAVWMFATELCVLLPTPLPLTSTVQGTRLIWSAIGCSAVCVIHRPSLTSNRDSHSDHILTPSQDTHPACQQLLGVDSQKWSPETERSAYVDRRGVLSAVAMGLGMACGSVTFLMAVKAAPPTDDDPVCVISGMYGGITTLLMRVVLKEQLTYLRYCGIVLALVAGSLLA